MTNFHTAYLARKSNQIVNILGQLESSAEEKEQGIYELLNDVPVDCEVVIQKTIVGGKTHISSVDVQPKTIRLFEEFTPKADRAFNVVGKLFLAFLYCERFGDTQPLYDALQEYKQISSYPITGTDVNDKEWMLLESAMLLEQIVHTILNRYAVGKPEVSTFEKMIQRLRLQVKIKK